MSLGKAEITGLESAEVKRLQGEARPDHAGPLRLCQGVWTGSSGQWEAS